MIAETVMYQWRVVSSAVLFLQHHRKTPGDMNQMSAAAHYEARKRFLLPSAIDPYSPGNPSD
jgi:hypothetical protein